VSGTFHFLSDLSEHTLKSIYTPTYAFCTSDRPSFQMSSTIRLAIRQQILAAEHSRRPQVLSRRVRALASLYSAVLKAERAAAAEQRAAGAGLSPIREEMALVSSRRKGPSQKGPHRGSKPPGRACQGPQGESEVRVVQLEQLFEEEQRQSAIRMERRRGRAVERREAGAIFRHQQRGDGTHTMVWNPLPPSGTPAFAEGRAHARYQQMVLDADVTRILEPSGDGESGPIVAHVPIEQRWAHPSPLALPSRPVCPGETLFRSLLVISHDIHTPQESISYPCLPSEGPLRQLGQCTDLRPFAKHFQFSSTAIGAY